MTTVDPVDELLTPAEVAEMFGVNSKTVARWADSPTCQAQVRHPAGTGAPCRA